MRSAELQEQALGLSVLRHQPDGDVGLERIGRRAKPDPAPIDEDIAMRHLRHAEASQEKVELAHALQSGNAEDLAFPQIETRIAQLVAGPQVADTQAPAHQTRHRFWAAPGKSGRSTGRQCSR